MTAELQQWFQLTYEMETRYDYYCYYCCLYEFSSSYVAQKRTPLRSPLMAEAHSGNSLITIDSMRKGRLSQTFLILNQAFATPYHFVSASGSACEGNNQGN